MVSSYFNTVGSKEGWTPSTFVSSRTNRQKDGASSQQRLEDFMDDEDVAEMEETRRIQTSDAFAGLGSSSEKDSHQHAFMDVLKTTGETMGIKLLKRMGWHEGQGIGPKVKRKAHLVDEDGDVEVGGSETNLHLFAPGNTQTVSFVKKDDRKGLGFEGEAKLGAARDPLRESESIVRSQEGRDESQSLGFLPKNKFSKEKPERKGGFGVGILNDNGSDDEDPYQMGPQISYNRVIGGEKKKKQQKPERVKSSSNPLISSKPIFMSKKSANRNGGAHVLRCYDGRLPLDGFTLLAENAEADKLVSQTAQYPPPEIPSGWKSTKTPLDPTNSDLAHSNYKSPAETVATANLSPKSRAAALGEVQLPGKSVFDFLDPAARDRIAAATNNSNLPPALREGREETGTNKTKTLSSLVPELDRETALAALGRGTAGWMPYSEDLEKRARYRTFLEIKGGLRDVSAVPDRATSASNDEWVHEINEFARAAQIFKPMTGTMASRFTSSSSAPKLASDNIKLDELAGAQDASPLTTGTTPKVKSTAEEAAAAGMHGPLTRSVDIFYPTRLLCKRFNVKPPSHVQPDASGTRNAPEQGDSSTFNPHKQAPPTHSTALPQKQLELVGKEQMEQLRLVGNGTEPSIMASVPEERHGGSRKEEQKTSATVEVNPERNEALELERPGEAVFKAIFGSDSEDD